MRFKERTTSPLAYLIHLKLYLYWKYNVLLTWMTYESWRMWKHMWKWRNSTLNVYYFNLVVKYFEFLAIMLWNVLCILIICVFHDVSTFFHASKSVSNFEQCWIKVSLAKYWCVCMSVWWKNWVIFSHTEVKSTSL